MNIKRYIIFITVFLWAVFTSSGLTSSIHAVIGTIQYEDSSFPENIDWTAYITARPDDVLNFEAPSMYDSTTGGFLIQCSGFISWAADETLHVDFTDTVNSVGSAEIVLTYDAYDNAGTVELSVPSSINSDKVKLVKDIELLQNYPNPFNPETVITWQVHRYQHIELAIYNALGEKIRILVSDYNAPGRYEAIWDGRNENGVQISSGTYFIKLHGEKQLLQSRAVLLK